MWCNIFFIYTCSHYLFVYLVGNFTDVAPDSDILHSVSMNALIMWLRTSPFLKPQLWLSNFKLI